MTQVEAPQREPRRSALRLADLVPLAVLALRSRMVRALLSGAGIAIGIASIVAVLGVTRSSESELLAKLNQLGTNLLTVTNGQDGSGAEVELPASAAPMIALIGDVQSVAPTAQLTAVNVFRNDHMPAGQTGGLSVRACDAALLGTLNGSLLTGRFLSTAPVASTVLGYDAATTLGVTTAGPGSTVWLGGRWFTVAGILKPLPLAPEIDESALVSFGTAARLLGYDGHPSRIYVRANPDYVPGVYQMLAATTNPESPSAVNVSRPSDALTAQIEVKDASGSLILGLGAIALLVGAVGIANVMVISVLERRSEIGLRRALGAARGHVAVQFLAESLVLSFLGGVTGVLTGVGITAAVARYRGWAVLIPGWTLWGGVLVAIAVGAIAGAYPAWRATLITPSDALRTT
jgi:putative ABC transport system permease protein